MNFHLAAGTQIRSPSRAHSFGAGRIVRGGALALLRMLGALVVLLLALPVLVLPFLTAVPAPVWLVLAALDVALLSLPFRHARTSIAATATAGGLVAVALGAVLASQWFAATPPITDSSGKAVPHSIALMEQVTLNGSEQWITIRGKDVHNPVLLFLAGGPGGSELPFVRNVLGALEDHFVVVNWDQPGAGKSYGAVPASQLTVERFVSDARALTLLLRERFHQDKIYVMGESWGTVLGIKLVQQDPQWFLAYIGAGQRTSMHEDDVLGYNFALQVASERGDAALLGKLRGNGPPPYSGSDMAFKNMDYLNVLNAYARLHARAEVTGHDLMGDVISGPEYGLLDKLNWFRGLLEGFTVVYPQLDSMDFGVQATHLAVPVYFLQGRWDYVEMSSLLERWYAALDAPHKEIIYFENSGHTPHAWEPGKVADVIINHVLPQTQPAPGGE